MVKVRYFRTSRDILVTALFDTSVSRMWSIQNAMETADGCLMSSDEVEGILKRSGFKKAAVRKPVYKAGKIVQVGTSGQRHLYRFGKYHAEYWQPGQENGQWGGHLLLWGMHLGYLLRLISAIVGDQIVEVEEASTSRVDFLPISYIREPVAKGKTIADRMRSILQDGMLAWNLRLALYRMRGAGQPIGDQISVDCLTGGYLYNFFNHTTRGCFSGERTALVLKGSVLERSSNRSYPRDSGAIYYSARVIESNKAEECLGIRTPGSTEIGTGEFLVFGHVPPSNLVVLTSDIKVKEVADEAGVECHFGPVYDSYWSLQERMGK